MPGTVAQCVEHSTDPAFAVEPGGTRISFFTWSSGGNGPPTSRMVAPRVVMNEHCGLAILGASAEGSNERASDAESETDSFPFVHDSPLGPSVNDATKASTVERAGSAPMRYPSDPGDRCCSHHP